MQQPEPERDAPEGVPGLAVPRIALEIPILITWILLVGGHEIGGFVLAIALLACQAVGVVGRRRRAREEDRRVRHVRDRVQGDGRVRGGGR